MLESGTRTKNSFKTPLFRSSVERMPRRRKKVMVIPAANVDETNNEYILTIASPGFRRENIEVNIDKDIITIAAAKEMVHAGCIHDRCEYDYSRWKRAFLLPDDANALHASARYKEGELIVRIPRGKTDNLPGLTTIYVY